MAENQGHDWKTDLTSLPRAEHTGVPQGIATFQGSFAQGTDDRVIATAVRSRWTVTVREGWLNSDVWKSAVGNFSPVLCCQHGYSNFIIVHRTRCDDASFLYFRFD